MRCTCARVHVLHMQPGTLAERRARGWCLVRGVGARVGSGEAVAPECNLVQWRLCSGASCGGARQPTSGRGARAAASCDMGLAARMLSSELEMYPMIAVAHEIAMVRTAGSICMARSAPGSLGHRREPAAAPAERAANFEDLNEPTTTRAKPLPKHRPTDHAEQITAQQEPGPPGNRGRTPGRRRADRRSAERRCGQTLRVRSGQMRTVGDKARKYCMPPAELEICSR